LQEKLQTGNKCTAELTQARGEIQSLFTWLSWNYMAVIKAVKKRNKVLQVTDQAV
jgi:hypothetical protein